VVATVKRIGRDKLRFRLSGEEVALLRSLPDQLRSVLAGAGSADSSMSLFADPTLGIDDQPAGQLPGGPGDWPDDAGAGQRDRGERAGDAVGPDDLVDPGSPNDPVLERLFPSAYLEPEDLDRDAEYQRLVRDDLLEAKLANLDVVTKTLDRGTVSLRRWTVDVSEEEAGAWLGALNDLRLALGVRLGITEDFEGDVDPSDPQAPALHILSYLGWLEENLLEALTSA
jgi:hypothetical protein